MSFTFNPFFSAWLWFVNQKSKHIPNMLIITLLETLLRPPNKREEAHMFWLKGRTWKQIFMKNLMVMDSSKSFFSHRIQSMKWCEVDYCLCFSLKFVHRKCLSISVELLEWKLQQWSIQTLLLLSLTINGQIFVHVPCLYSSVYFFNHLCWEFTSLVV